MAMRMMLLAIGVHALFYHVDGQLTTQPRESVAMKVYQQADATCMGMKLSLFEIDSPVSFAP